MIGWHDKGERMAEKKVNACVDNGTLPARISVARPEAMLRVKVRDKGKRRLHLTYVSPTPIPNCLSASKMNAMNDTTDTAIVCTCAERKQKGDAR